MKTNRIKIGSLYRLNVPIFAFNNNPHPIDNRSIYRMIEIKEFFIVLDYFLRFSGKNNIFILKILLEDKVKFLIATENNLIEIKEDTHDYL